MELEYSIFNRKEVIQYDVEFKMVLDEEDYILIKQFESSTFQGFLTFGPKEIIKSENFHSITDQNLGSTTLEYFWGNDHIKQYKSEDGIYTWETKLYYLRRKVVAPIWDGEKIINNVKEYITDIMKDCKTRLDPESCLKETAVIDY